MYLFIKDCNKKTLQNKSDSYSKYFSQNIIKEEPSIKCEGRFVDAPDHQNNQIKFKNKFELSNLQIIKIPRSLAAKNVKIKDKNDSLVPKNNTDEFFNELFKIENEQIKGLDISINNKKTDEFTKINNINKNKKESNFKPKKITQKDPRKLGYPVYTADQYVEELKKREKIIKGKLDKRKIGNIKGKGKGGKGGKDKLKNVRNKSKSNISSKSSMSKDFSNKSREISNYEQENDTDTVSSFDSDSEGEKEKIKEKIYEEKANQNFQENLMKICPYFANGIIISKVNQQEEIAKRLGQDFDYKELDIEKFIKNQDFKNKHDKNLKTSIKIKSFDKNIRPLQAVFVFTEIDIKNEQKLLSALKTEAEFIEFCTDFIRNKKTSVNVELLMDSQDLREYLPYEGRNAEKFITFFLLVDYEK